MFRHTQRLITSPCFIVKRSSHLPIFFLALLSQALHDPIGNEPACIFLADVVTKSASFCEKV